MKPFAGGMLDDANLAEVGTRFCRRCEYCQPCLEGVHIPLMMNLPGFWKRFPTESFVSGWIA